MNAIIWVYRTYFTQRARRRGPATSLNSGRIIMRLSPHLNTRQYSTMDRCNEAIFACEEYIGGPLGTL